MGSYGYWINRREGGFHAVLNKGDDYPLKKLGVFKTEQDAKDHCARHFEKACRALDNLGKERPTMYFY